MANDVCHYSLGFTGQMINEAANDSEESKESKDKIEVVEAVTAPEETQKIKPKKEPKKVSLWFTIALVLLLNAVWFLGMEFYVKPSYDATINQQNGLIQEQNDYIAQIQTDYTNSIADLQTQVDTANAKITEIQSKIQ